MSESIELRWKRPESLEYPNTWRRFKAKDTTSDNFIEYCIQDLPESRFDEALDSILPVFLRD